MKKMMLFLVCIVLFSLIRGYHEGMIMVMPDDSTFVCNTEVYGVRCHEMFKYYHVISVMVIFFAVLTFIFLPKLHMSIISEVSLWVAISLIIWEFTEIGYALARSGSLLFYRNGVAYEHINFLDIIDFIVVDGDVILLHIFRIILMPLLIRGTGTTAR